VENFSLMRRLCDPYPLRRFLKVYIVRMIPRFKKIKLVLRDHSFVFSKVTRVYYLE